MNDDSTEKRMAGNYEVIQAVHIGDREVVLGENPQDDTGMKYMCAFCRQNALFAEYSEVMASDDFPEIVELFGQRVAEQAQKTHIPSGCCCSPCAINMTRIRITAQN